MYLKDVDKKVLSILQSGKPRYSKPFGILPKGFYFN